jgi:hypothetical protein
MLGKALGRRGILRGFLGASAAAGLGRVNAGGHSFASHGGIPIGRDEAAEHPDWLSALRKTTEKEANEFHDRPTIDGFDLDIAVMTSWSPAMKATIQRRRNIVRYEASSTLWERLHDTERKWRRSFVKAVGL